MSRKSDLPFGSEFSPSQIELRRALELAEQHGGEWRAFEAAMTRVLRQKRWTAGGAGNTS